MMGALTHNYALACASLHGSAAELIKGHARGWVTTADLISRLSERVAACDAAEELMQKYIKEAA